MNRDGIPDLFVANQSLFGNNDGGVEVLLGNGDGSFQAPVAYDSGGGFSVAVVAADLNGDGIPDAVVANQCGNNKNFCSGTAESGVGVLLTNANGTFQPAVSYLSGGSYIQSIAVGKLFDGTPAVVMSNLCALTTARNCGTSKRDGTVGVLIGAGAGSFFFAGTYDAGGFQTSGLAFADVNGDGNLDVVVANACASSSNCVNGSVAVLLGDGFGHFAKAVTYPAGNFPVSVVIADVNGDQKPDLLVTDFGSASPQQVSVLLGNGDGTFLPAVAYDSGGTSTSSIAVGNVNGDGKADLVVSNAGSNTDCRTVVRQRRWDIPATSHVQLRWELSLFDCTGGS